ncbi:MAG: acyltransferase [Paucibacter sp.]|nr:acyltransferase [Roseateles sp.]
MNIQESQVNHEFRSSCKINKSDLQSSKMRSVEVVRTVAIFAVIVIHTKPFEDTYISFGTAINVGYLLNQLARFAVPFFFVMSGYFWGSKINSGSPIVDSTRKMSKRIITIFLAWSTIYLLPANLFDVSQYASLGPLRQFYWNIFDLFKHPVQALMEGSRFHLWFLVALINCLAISAAFVALNMKWALICLSILFYGIGLLGKAYADTPMGFHSEFNFRNGPFFGLIFFVTGYVLSGSRRRQSWLILGLSSMAFGTLMHFAEIFMLRALWGTTILQDFVFGTYFMGVGAALVALSNPKLVKLNAIANIGPLVLGIYAIHLVFVDLLHPFGQALKGAAWWGFCYPVGVFVMSLAATFALSRIRLTRKFVV